MSTSPDIGWPGDAALEREDSGAGCPLRSPRLLVAALLTLLVIGGAPESALNAAPFAVDLPDPVEAVWDLEKAFRESTPTRERICLNGLWRWQPADPGSEQVPSGHWGYFKVPGSWPGITDYMQKDSQTVFAHPNWLSTRLGGISSAWYEREFAVPAHWSGRQITLSLEYLNSYAAVYLDGAPAGELRFPGGELNLTGKCQPGRIHRLSLQVVALPLKGVMLSYADSATARQVQGSVNRRGLCGDVFLVGAPSGPRIVDVAVHTSVRKKEIEVVASLERLEPKVRYILRGRVTERGGQSREFSSPPFTARESAEGGDRVAFTEQWVPEKLWDLPTPENTFNLEIALLDDAGRERDAFWEERFGFREFWIEGRDFFLNGTRLFLSAVPLDNAQVGAAQANYAAARESLERLKGFGINFVYTHNYGCEPGSHLGFKEILRAADDVGMLVALSQPHFSHYDWQAADADGENGYARHAAFYAGAAQSHPSVVMYAMSHNATGYHEDMNPDMIDGLQDGRDAWASRNVKLALRAEAIVKQLDPSRPVYHHASGNLGTLHAINFYPNFVPIQELSDWFGHWATAGVKPVFLCEYGAPFTWDWTMYRGWYRGEREFGSARVPWEFCLAEWNAQFLGDSAFPASDAEQANLRWEARQFRAGNLWHRWDYPSSVGSTRFDERYPVFAAYLTDNWRAFRTWGVSALSPWEHEHFWKLRQGVDRSRKALPVEWEQLQRPGFSPDYLDQRYERMDLAFDRSDWIATEAARALIRNNRPLLAYLSGKADRFTSQDHNFVSGETVEKQIIVINNSRGLVTCDVQWSFALPDPVSGQHQIRVPTGQQERVPLRVVLPTSLPSGRYVLSATFRFSNGETQQDSFTVDVLPPAQTLPPVPRIALFDPRGETAAWLKRLGIQSESVGADADLSRHGVLLVGKSALTLDGPAPDIRRVRDGLKVIVFEQSSRTLERRFGFRVAEYGLRQAFLRVPDHPLLAGLAAEHLSDWRGEATLLNPRLTYELRPRHGPTVQWCGIPVTRAWRCGNRGNVASVLIEKPARGDFLPVVDGGYGLQYSPLLEYREGSGMVLFCQMDITGRTESEPAAERLVRNILEDVSTWRPPQRRDLVYAGDPAGASHLNSAGFSVAAFQGGPFLPGQLLVVGPEGGRALADHSAALATWLRAGGCLVGIGLDQADARALPLGKVTMKRAEHISTWFEPFAAGSPFAGIGPADVHNRDPREVSLVAGGAEVIGNGVLARAETANAFLCQLAPWQFDSTSPMNLKRTHRRVAFLLSRLLGNLGAAAPTPLLERFSQPVHDDELEQRWLEGFYLDQPEEWDDPYRFFRW